MQSRLALKNLSAAVKAGEQRSGENWKIRDQLAANHETIMENNIINREATPTNTIRDSELLLFKALIIIY